MTSIKLRTVLSLFCFVTCMNTQSYSQAVSYVDPAQAYNRILLEKNSGSYLVVGAFKVTGNPYLFGPKISGTVYGKTGIAKQVPVSYNTYNQQIETYNGNKEFPAINDAVDIDSFVISSDLSKLIDADMHFINGRFALSDQKSFLMVVYQGPRFSIYKKFKSELGYVSTNYVQSELREFDLQYEYIYTDTATREARKVKLTMPFLKREFKSVKDISNIINQEDLSVNPQLTMIKLFSELNKQ